MVDRMEVPSSAILDVSLALGSTKSATAVNVLADQMSLRIVSVGPGAIGAYLTMCKAHRLNQHKKGTTETTHLRCVYRIAVCLLKLPIVRLPHFRSNILFDSRP